MKFCTLNVCFYYKTFKIFKNYKTKKIVEKYSEDWHIQKVELRSIENLNIRHMGELRIT